MNSAVPSDEASSMPRTQSATDLTELAELSAMGLHALKSPCRRWGSHLECTEDFTGTRRSHASQLVVKADGGAVTIRGTVPDEAAKAKVISLAKDTFGVTRVTASSTLFHRASTPAVLRRSMTPAPPRSTPNQSRFPRRPSNRNERINLAIPPIAASFRRYRQSAKHAIH